MSLKYSGSSYVDYTFTDASTRLDLVNNLNTQLKNAGWSVISGDGTGDVLMKTAVTSDGLSVRFRLFDPGSGNCAQFTMKNNAGTLTSSIGYLLPGGFQWRIIANKYTFFMFRTGNGNVLALRSSMMGGTIWAPSNMVSIMGSDLDVGWFRYNGTSDTDTQVRHTFRDALANVGTTSNSPGSTLYQSNMVNYITQSQSNVVPAVLDNAMNGSESTATEGASQFQDGTGFIIEPWLAWSGTSSASGQSSFKGMMWDALINTLPYDGESTITHDSHTWRNITHQSVVLNQTGSLFVRVA